MSGNNVKSDAIYSVVPLACGITKVNAGEPLSQPPYGYMKSPDKPKFWIIDEEAAQVVRSVFKMCIEGKGNETIAKATARSQEVARLYERVYEDNVNGKVTDAWFMELSHKYEVERDELKKKILELNQQLAKISEVRDGKEHFLSCVRSFAEMNEVTPMILQELIDRIEVYAVKGTGLNRTQPVIIHYKFIDELDMPENFEKIKVNTRKGVEVEYLRTTKTA